MPLQAADKTDSPGDPYGDNGMSRKLFVRAGFFPGRGRGARLLRAVRREADAVLL